MIFLHPDDMRERDLAAEVAVDITSHHGGETHHARNLRVVPYDVPRGCAAAYFPKRTSSYRTTTWPPERHARVEGDRDHR